jgi:amino acid adenylation domain-containing protein
MCAARLARTRRVEQLVARQVSLRPGATAVDDGAGRALRYSDLWARSGALSAAIADLGLGRGAAVAVALERSIELVVAVLGVVRSGAAYVLLDPHSPPARNDLIVEEVAARAIIQTHETAQWTTAKVAHCITMPVAAQGRGRERTVDSALRAEDTAYFAYTSGSTGRPKGVVVPHRAVVHFVMERRLGSLGPGDRVASLSSPASDATTLELWKTLASGATVVVLPDVVEVGVEGWRDVLVRNGITTMFIMAGLMELISRYDSDVFASLDTLIFGGEAANPAAVRRICLGAPPRRLVLGYGPTETTVFATSFDCTGESVLGRDRIPLGYPLEGYSALIVDETLRPAAPGAIGELCIGGPGVARGYLKQPDLTAQRFVRLGTDLGHTPDAGLVYRSGDLVRQLPDGALEFVARLDRQVKIRGFRVELEEVERAILATGMVHTAAVERVDGPDPAHLVAFVVPASGVDVSNETSFKIIIAAATAERVPGYMVPARWVVYEKLPVTSIGKVDRAQLVNSLNLT